MTAAAGTANPLPTVTIVLLVFNRREELRISLERTLRHSDYDRDKIDVIVVDNASTDGSAAMVEQEFPAVRVVQRLTNVGVSGINDGFALATGDWVLGLDDDCYLPPDGLRRAVLTAEERRADLVSFGVISSGESPLRFDQHYRTGLLAYWGCAVLMRRRVIGALKGYDPAIFVWGNEVEFMIRFFDRRFRHLHLPEVVAVHLKPGLAPPAEYLSSPTYRFNCRNFAYAAGKLLCAHDAVLVLCAVLAMVLRDVIRIEPRAWRGAAAAVGGFAAGLRRRQPVRAAVSRAYCENFHSFAPPWRFSRSPLLLLRQLPREALRAARGLPREDRDAGRFDEYVDERSRFYPTAAATLQI